ncbi:type I-B CRISPR-associated protein Cas7/Csh2 [Aminobacterium sp. MB27-C1]|uniref:type I-B CRISPR-associated protein Cas7/Csh2 n=1 Tax=Aminobacterium sp. MB27-C1 TaxID=3070661 RepID=UPI001BCB55F7|nr:type I-B CRISPR-associated protein Cas7/Csh2 [Aminobacterium sp. MB27-C1]WMI71213.1 type I-B CRISPR-associated protein Cas7/Csh2 [Aminobacterium sp. MB27-C1]
MAFNNRREYLFVYSVKDANPNGDPLDANHPRHDEETGQMLVSDVRIKRTVRDQWLMEKKDVFVDSEPKTLKERVEELKAKLSVDKGCDALSRCIDTRLFGATFALGKESFSWAGPVQFKWGRSLHRAEAKLIQGTAAFATKAGSEQRSFRNEYIVPFSLIAAYGIANQYASKETGATDEDLDDLTSALWKGTTNLITRSKVGHAPRMLMEVTYIDGYDGAVGSLDEKVALRSPDGGELSDDEQLALRSVNDFRLDMSHLVDKLAAREGKIEKIRLFIDGDLETDGMDELEEEFRGKLEVETR